jgi:hypothetical protein
MARVKTDLPAILSAIKTKLTTTDNLFLSNCVMLTEADDRDLAAASPSQRFVTIKPRDFDIDQGIAEGCGQTELVIRGSVEISLFTRTTVDRYAAGDELLTNSTLGGVAVWAEVLQSLHVYDLLVSTDQILCEPMRCRRFSLKPQRVEPYFSKLESMWEIKYWQRVNYRARTAGGEIT